MLSPDTVKKFAVLALAVLAAADKSGAPVAPKGQIGTLPARPGSMPSGHLYAQLMPHGATLETHEATLHFLGAAKLVTVAGHVVTLTPLGQEAGRRVLAALGESAPKVEPTRPAPGVQLSPAAAAELASFEAARHKPRKYVIGADGRVKRGGKARKAV